VVAKSEFYRVGNRFIGYLVEGKRNAKHYKNLYVFRVNIVDLPYAIDCEYIEGVFLESTTDDNFSSKKGC